MHSLFQKANGLTGEIIAAAIEVHRELGPGLLESIYERCLMREFEIRGIEAIQQKAVKVIYKDFEFEENLRFDVLVEQSVMVEVKAVETVHPIHKAQLLSYMKLLDIPLGLLINFHELKLVDGVSRMMLPNANK